MHQGSRASYIVNSEDLLFMLRSYPPCPIKSFSENLTRETLGSTELCPSVLLFFGVLASELPYLSLRGGTFLNIQLGSLYRPFSTEISPVCQSFPWYRHFTHHLSTHILSNFPLVSKSHQIVFFSIKCAYSLFLLM